MWSYGYGYWGFPFFPIIWLVFWIVLIGYIFRGRHKWSRYHESHSDKSAEDILADRFANGEIDEKEYEDRIEVLKKHRKARLFVNRKSSSMRVRLLVLYV